MITTEHLKAEATNMPKIEIEPGVELFYEELGSGDRYLICTQVGHSRYTPERAMATRGFHVFLLYQVLHSEAHPPEHPSYHQVPCLQTVQ